MKGVAVGANDSSQYVRIVISMITSNKRYIISSLYIITTYDYPYYAACRRAASLSEPTRDDTKTDNTHKSSKGGFVKGAIRILFASQPVEFRMLFADRVHGVPPAASRISIWKASAPA